jgi:hypothetical protein
MVINIRVLREVPLRTKWLASVPEDMRKFWFNGTRDVAGYTSFPKITQIRGHNSEKGGTEPGNPGGFSTRIFGVTFSRIWMAKVKAVWRSGRFGSR